MALIPKGKVEIREDRCKGCGLCVDACNIHLMHMSEETLNENGYHPAVFSDPENKCSACALCAVMCPDVALTVSKRVDEEEVK